MTQTIPPPPDDDPTSVLDPAPHPGPPSGGEPEAARRFGWGLALGALVPIAVAAAAAAAYFATRGGPGSSADTTAAVTATAPTGTAALVPADRVIVRTRPA